MTTDFSSHHFFLSLTGERESENNRRSKRETQLKFFIQRDKSRFCTFRIHYMAYVIKGYFHRGNFVHPMSIIFCLSEGAHEGSHSGLALAPNNSFG